jgi:plasmid stabilization system protein ParE
MARIVVWTKRANYKFNNIISYLEAEWGERITKNFVLRSYDIIELLKVNPKLGSSEKDDIRGFLITKQNRIFYRFTNDEIIILNFFDTRSKQKKF